MTASRDPSSDASTPGIATDGARDDAVAELRATTAPGAARDAIVWPDGPPGQLLTSGTRADVYAIDDARVLRRYRSGASAEPEVEIVRHVIAHGFPAPEVYWAGGPEIVMERLHGPTLLQAMTAFEVTFTDAGRILADLHTRLHAIPALRSSDRRAVTVHLDLHPANIILSETRGPVLLNWAHARAGAAAMDVATTALILAEVIADAVSEYSQAARSLLVHFLDATTIDPRPALHDAERHRIIESNLVPGEHALVPAAAELVRHYAAVRHDHVADAPDDPGTTTAHG